MPNPNLPEMDTPRGEEELLHNFGKVELHTIAVVPNTSEIVVSNSYWWFEKIKLLYVRIKLILIIRLLLLQYFLEQIDNLWSSVRQGNASRISWVLYATEKELMSEYWHRPKSISIAVLFDNEDPLDGPLQ